MHMPGVGGDLLHTTAFSTDRNKGRISETPEESVFLLHGRVMRGCW
jgi:hypothetical protein